MSYTYKYARPALTVDCVVFGLGCNETLNVLLIQRAQEPFRGWWALPGGFAEVGESLEAAAARELAEETGLTDVPLEQLHTFSNPDRDPREHVVSVAYLARVDPGAHKARAATDASNVAWFPVDDLPKLAFDHGEIIAVAGKRLGTA